MYVAFIFQWFCHQSSCFSPSPLSYGTSILRKRRYILLPPLLGIDMFKQTPTRVSDCIKGRGDEPVGKFRTIFYFGKIFGSDIFTWRTLSVIKNNFENTNRCIQINLCTKFVSELIGQLFTLYLVLLLLGTNWMLYYLVNL